MTLTTYKDNLIQYNLYTEEECDESNVVDIDAPEELIREWFDIIENPEGFDFDTWYNEEYTCVDTDGFVPYFYDRYFKDHGIKVTYEYDF